MKRLLTTVLTLATMSSTAVAADDNDLEKAWMVGLHLGELPWQGSFKPGLSLGYHLNDLVYFGALFQIGDEIRRDATSFNVQNTGLDGLLKSSETVAPRAFVGARVRPHRYAPFASLGVVYNGADVETMDFDARARIIGTSSYEGTLTIRQQRPAAFRPAIGVGYSYTFGSGLEVSTAWSGWIFGRPGLELDIDSESVLSSADEASLRHTINEGFGSTITNKYHIFHIGAGYAFGGKN